jgi:Phytanoyl-CoA dioxygenase (PhyH)
MLSAEERREFDERGVLRLAGLVDPRRAAALREEVLALVAARRLAPESPPPGFAVSPSRTARVSNAYGFEEIWGVRAFEAIDDLLGAGAWHVPEHAGQLLAMTWPQRDTSWALPHRMWHLDYPAPGALTGLPGVQLFLCVDRVESRGGATLVAAGTPRAVDRIRRRAGPEWPGRSADVRRALRAELPWFRELCSLRPGEDRIERYMNRASAVGAESFQVVELTGDPGDVWVMHPWMVHDASPNCGTRPRMALTERIRARLALDPELVQ